MNQLDNAALRTLNQHVSRHINTHFFPGISCALEGALAAATGCILTLTVSKQSGGLMCQIGILTFFAVTDAQIFQPCFN